MPLQDIDTSYNAVTYSRAIARQLGLQEKDIWKLLVGTKITASSFIYDDQPISNEDQKIIFQNCLNISQSESYGLNLGDTLTPASHGAMGFLANCSPTLYTALENFSQYLPTRVSFRQLKLFHDERYVYCRMFTSYKDHEEIQRMIIEAFAVSLNILIETILGHVLTEAHLSFSFKRPRYWKEYQQHFNCSIRFDQPQNQLVFSSDIKDFLNISSDFKTYQHYETWCKNQLEKLSTQKNSTTERVKKHLLLAPPGKSLTEEEIASAMFISKRTLSRRLKAEGTIYRKVRDEVINSLAKSYLVNTDIPIENIAHLLNYHDSSSFRRAFKRTNVISPQMYRKEARSKQSG